MSESPVNVSHVEEIVTQVLTQLVQDGGDEDQMSVELLQEQVELHLEYDSGSLSKWHNFLGRTLRDFFKSKNPASVHTGYCTHAGLGRLRCHQEMGDYYRDFKGGREQQRYSKT